MFETIGLDLVRSYQEKAINLQENTYTNLLFNLLIPFCTFQKKCMYHKKNLNGTAKTKLQKAKCICFEFYFLF